MKRNIFKIATGIIALIFCASIPKIAFADEPQSVMVVSPMNQKIILTPGESKTMSLKISNPNTAKNELHYSVSVGSFGYDSNDNIDTTSTTSYNQMMDWIELGADSGVVQPNESTTVSFTINVPENTPAGGQYATILIQDDTSIYSSGNSNVSIENIVQMASIIYAEVAGKTVDTGQILENDIPSISFTNQLEATSLVKNTGNVHTDAKYTFQVWPLLSDEEICTNEEDSETNLIMPGMERYYTQTCTVPLVGIFRAKQTVKIFGEESIIEKTIFVCPLWLLFIIIFAIAALIIWLIFHARTRKGPKDKSKNEE